MKSGWGRNSKEKIPEIEQIYQSKYLTNCFGEALKPIGMEKECTRWGKGVLKLFARRNGELLSN